MLSVDLPKQPGRLAVSDLMAKRSRRSVKNAMSSMIMATSLLVVLIPLAFIVVNVVQRGGGSLSWSFLTHDIPVSARTKGPGMGPAIVGTVLITGLATLMAVPVGVLAAIHINEYSEGGRFGKVIRFMATVMTGVPSVVMGLFVYVTYTLRFKFNAFGGALALAALMLPIIIRSTEEMLRLVPNGLREASAALGARKSRTVLTVVVPAAIPGIVSGALLAVARAAGETAPILFVVGVANARNLNPFTGGNTALSAQIFGNATSPFAGAQERAWGAAMTLLIIAFMVTLAARVFTARYSRER
jgi:phosphate transport system permease protein